MFLASRSVTRQNAPAYATPGIVSAASKAAQKGRVLMVTVDSNGNLATAAVPACNCLPIAAPTKKKR